MGVKFELFGRLKHSKKKSRGSGKDIPTTTDIHAEIPVSVIQNLSSQGLSQNEMINQLRSQGYTYSQINQGMNNVVKSEAVRETNSFSEVPPMPNASSGKGVFDEFGMGRPGQGSIGQDPFLDQDMQPVPQQELPPPAQEVPKALVPENTEELIEVMIAEKLIDVEDHFDKISKEIGDLGSQIHTLQEQVKELYIRKDEDEKKFLGKVDELEQYMEVSHGKIGGLEKALQQVLPTLVENVRDLTGMMKEVRKD